MSILKNINIIKTYSFPPLMMAGQSIVKAVPVVGVYLLDDQKTLVFVAVDGSSLKSCNSVDTTCKYLSPLTPIPQSLTTSDWNTWTPAIVSAYTVTPTFTINNMPPHIAMSKGSSMASALIVVSIIVVSIIIISITKIKKKKNA